MARVIILQSGPSRWLINGQELYINGWLPVYSCPLVVCYVVNQFLEIGNSALIARLTCLGYQPPAFCVLTLVVASTAPVRNVKKHPRFMIDFKVCLIIARRSIDG